MPVKLTQTSKKPTHLTAPAYVEALMTWTQSILDDEKHFPQKIGQSFSLSLLFSDWPWAGVKFPSTFTNTAKTILRRLFRVYAHIYHQHFDQICALGIEGTWSVSICIVVWEHIWWYSTLEHQLPPLPAVCWRGKLRVPPNSLADESSRFWAKRISPHSKSSTRAFWKNRQSSLFFMRIASLCVTLSFRYDSYPPP